MVIIDTSILIDHLRKQPNRESVFERIARKFPKEELAISVVSVQEVFQGASTRSPERLAYLVALLSAITIMPYTYEIAQKAGEVNRDLGDPIEFADAAIATTTIINGAKLATLNQKDFARIGQLDLYADLHTHR